MQTFLNKVQIYGLFVWLAAAAPLAAQSVERIDKLPSVSAPLATFDGAVRWNFSGGKWETDDTIPGYMEIRQTSVASVSYLVLVRKTREGAWKYPAIQAGYYEYIRARYYLFDRKKLASVISEKTEMNKAYVVDLEVFRKSHGREDETSEQMASNIYAAVSSPISKYNEFSEALWIGVFPVVHDGKKKVRF